MRCLLFEEVPVDVVGSVGGKGATQAEHKHRRLGKFDEQEIRLHAVQCTRYGSAQRQVAVQKRNRKRTGQGAVVGDCDNLLADGDDLFDEGGFFVSQSGHKGDMVSTPVKKFDQSVDRLASGMPYRRCRELFVCEKDSRHVTAW
jgi:hypothetical protein